MGDRLDEEKLEILRTWGCGLVEDDRDEIRAAGKAILILVDEIEQLQVDLWHAHGDQAAPADGAHLEAVEPQAPALASTLRARLAGRLAVEPVTPRADL